MSQDKKGIIIGRFQPFHKGHKYLIDKYREKYDDILVGIGEPGEETPEDPLSYEIRKKIIKEGYDQKFPVFEVEDQGDPERWIEEVEKELGINPKERDLFEAVTGNDYTAMCFEDAGYDVEKLDSEDLYKPDIYSGCEIRRLAEENKEWEDRVPDFTVKVLEGEGISLGEKIRSLEKSSV